nr:outer membrane beta-barrel protein [Cognatiyoonia koreensis]
MHAKTLTATAAALAMVGFAGAANAGGLAEPVVQPAPAPLPAPVPAPVSYGGDWGGFYAGGQLGWGQLDSDAFGDADPDGALYGVHAGYNYDFGSFVLGAELDYDATDISDDATGIDLDSVARFKVKAGYDAGRFLPYVTAGIAQATTSGALDADDDGQFAGVGVDYQFNDSIRVGAEALQHQFDDFDGSGADIDATTIAARVSYTF